MHLFIPGYLEANHQWGFDVSRYVWAVMPSLGAWVFALGFMLGDEMAVRLINVAFIFAPALLVRRLAVWAFANRQAGLWSAALFLSAPLTFAESSSLYIEAIWASYVVGGVYCLFRLDAAEGQSKHHLVAGGLLLGLACATKAVTLALAPVLILAFLARSRRWMSRDAIVPALIGVGGFALVGSIPYIRAWLTTGNPVFPIFNSIFKSAYFPLMDFTQTLFDSGLSWNTIYRITFESEKYLESTAGAPGFQRLLLLGASIAALLLTRRRRGAQIALTSLLMIAVTFQFQSHLRYVFPAMVLLAVRIGGAYANVFSSSAAIRWPGYVLFGAALSLNLAF